MDILYFLQRRTRFIERFYADASVSFAARRAAIYAGEEPYSPAYDDDGEPRFLAELTEAEEALDVLGQACISMLASALKLYLVERVDELRQLFGCGPPNQAAFKNGWVEGYHAYFRDVLYAEWQESGADLSMLEEIVLTRNLVQHPDNITNLGIRQSAKDFSKFPRAFFADETEKQIYTRDDTPDGGTMWPWRLNVTGDKLSRAIEEVERLCTWLETRPNWPQSTSGPPIQ